MMLAGALDRLVTLQRATMANDSFNTPVPTWGDLATVWAAAVPVSDRERLAASEVSASITHRFTIRWTSGVSDLSPTDRLTFDGRTFDIFGVKEIGRREGLEITAMARAD
jgi:SPP1 family predicted phage head-tail adaptor